MSRSTGSLLLLLLPALAGCAHWSQTSLGVWGPYPDTEAELVRRVVRAVETRGFTVTRVDVERGIVDVRSNLGSRCRARPAFRFRFYRGAWVELRPVGCHVILLPDGTYTLPTLLHREYVALAAGLLAAPR